MQQLFLIFVSLVLLSGQASAEAYLQLDLSDSAYHEPTETIYTTSSDFTLFALVDSTKTVDTDGFYYLSVALTGPDLEGIDPAVSETGYGSDEFGSFTFAETPYYFVGSAEYGVPPVSSDAEKRPTDLSTHDNVFPTYYYEFRFSLDSLTDSTADSIFQRVSKDENNNTIYWPSTVFNPGTAPLYNSQETPGGIDISTTGPLHYAAFSIDVSTLEPGYGIHFDLYTIGETGKISSFAPYSHDAGVWPENPFTSMPEPATMMLFGFGLIGMAGIGRRRYAKQP